MFFIGAPADLVARASAAEALALAGTKHKFVSRGNFTTHDFTLNDFTKDNDWHELSLSSIIPEGTVAVFVIGEVRDPLKNRGLMLRKKGATNNDTVARVVTIGDTTDNAGSIMLEVSSDRKIEYKLALTISWEVINLSVVAWLI